MTTYILINSSDKSILGVYTDREVAVKMMLVFKSNGRDLYCQTVQVSNTIPAWAERVLEIA